MSQYTITIYDGIETGTVKAANPLVRATCKETGLWAESSATDSEAVNGGRAIQALEIELEQREEAA